MRLQRCCFLLTFLLLETTCAPVAGISLVIPPEFFAAGGQFTVAVRFLQEGTPLGRVLLNTLEGSPTPLLEGEDADRDYVKKPLRLDFGFAQNLSDGVLVHIVLFNNSQNEVQSAFLPIADSRESTFFGADARVDHTVLPNLSPVGFALLRINPSSPRDQKIALLPYDAEGDGVRDFDLDFDTIPVIPPPTLEDGTELCPFVNTEPKIQKLQCQTFFALTADPGLQLLDCSDANDEQNVFEVDECFVTGEGSVDQDCSGAARVSCTPVDEDGDGACLGARPEDLFGDPATDAICPNGFDDCDDTDPANAVECP